ncbi:hypothetical protein EM868_00755 [Cupriavidus gilardii]|uniref:hypothetical protein n=1 Tax=Cupriavidus gilardii TaxID=82541 RepID=UPI001EE52D12|nr:hypothetical protein [Cupriavidus gilardii]MCG5260483.1 hypothetical protein [Cupriavidus gilardii]MDF9428332.1 hypothetical protein [Cupriavidus gilardii]
MLTSDTSLQLAYAERPDMLLRLAEFAASYALQEKPALVVQASPEERTGDFDLTDDNRIAALNRGTDRNIAWWGAFHSTQAVRPVFRGLACLDARENPQWAFELHRDGTAIAGVWVFPESNRDSAALCLHDFYTGVFEDFVEKTLWLISDPAQPYRLTATLLQANHLHFALGKSGWSRLLPPPRLTTLQWPLRFVSGSDTWHVAAASMNIELFGAYGEYYRPGPG